MKRAFRASAFVPRGFVVDDATSDDAGTLITARSVARASACPDCGSPSERVHSRYRRRLADLPISGRPVRLMVLARRFYCNAVLCGRRVFAERFDADVLAPWARRAARLEHIGSVASVMGRWSSSSRVHPLAGFVLLPVVGAGPPPDA